MFIPNECVITIKQHHCLSVRSSWEIGEWTIFLKPFQKPVLQWADTFAFIHSKTWNCYWGRFRLQKRKAPRHIWCNHGMNHSITHQTSRPRSAHLGNHHPWLVHNKEYGTWQCLLPWLSALRISIRIQVDLADTWNKSKVCVVHFARIKAFQVKRATEQVSYRHAEQCRWDFC